MIKRVALLLFFIVSPLVASQEYTEWSDSGIQGPKYSVILDQFEMLAQKYAGISRWIEYGKTVKGRSLRLLAVFKQNAQKTDKRPTLVMSGSTHGNEYLNLEDRIPEELLKLSSENTSIARFLNSGGAFVFIPILNPDGYDARTRENSNGVDLNRDFDVAPANFTGFKEVESRLLSIQLDALTKAPYNFDYKVTVDYHCCIGAILYPWSYTANPIPESSMTKHVEIAEVADKNLKIEHGTTSQILGYYALGTTKDYYYSKYGATAFTFEGRFGEENKNLTKHVSWWREMVEMMDGTSHLALLSLKSKRRHPFLKIAD